MLKSLAVVMEEPEHLALTSLALDPPAATDVVVETHWSGVSTGTERLLYTGKMPMFPGMGYPLVPGYETVGTIVEVGADAGLAVGSRVFVPGARCYGAVRGLHGGAASHLVSPASRVVPVSSSLGENAVLLALGATALHAISPPDGAEANFANAIADGVLIIGHGVLGRLLARLALLSRGKAPVVWEKNPVRTGGAVGYEVISPEDDPRRDYRVIFDVSGDAGILDHVIQRLAPGGEIVLAGFYDTLSFNFPPAFMREARIRIAAQWREGDLAKVVGLIESGRLSLDGLITHRRLASEASEAYPIAFSDPSCLKMVLDWRERK
jgi:3-hydroxyethyl bacteriochlorophyllide a dehydrogenase